MADGGIVAASGTDRRVFLISERAARRIGRVVEGEAPGTFLRVAVSGGGCSGFQYSFDLDHSRQDDDLSFTRDAAEVVIDDASLDLVAGAELDFVEDLSSAAFAITNPNASSSCGCGMSFSIG